MCPTCKRGNRPAGGIVHVRCSPSLACACEWKGSPINSFPQRPALSPQNPIPTSPLTEGGVAAGGASRVPEASRTTSAKKSGKDRAEPIRAASRIDEEVGLINQPRSGLVSI
ncbi:unnamed protein product [Urochloa humidicola]